LPVFEPTRKGHAAGITESGCRERVRPESSRRETFYQDGKRVFWDVHHPEKTIVIDLHDERYKELIVEVDDPAEAVKLIQTVL
jgi:hypothetical protein